MAEAVGISLAAKLAEYLVDPALQQLQYLFCVRKITRNAEIKKEELILKQGRVQQRVQEAINKTERIDDEVKQWNNEVKSLIAEVENCLEQELWANNGCFRGWCPAWRRYYLCKKLAKTTQRMIELNTKSDQFNSFSHPVVVPDIEYHFFKDFLFFESTKMAYDQLWEALQDDGSSIIGLWGMGGSGKTTLVKEVGKKAKEAKLFDRVVFTTISQTLQIRKIQGEIADTLGLKLEEESGMGRAKRIALRLQSSGERILMILDDVWATLNLEDIGNPFCQNHQRTCKVLITTRRQDVCNLMDCQKTIPLQLLTEDEAWTLFQTHANVDDSATEVMAREVAKECKGLPVAIVAMGATLKGKGLDEMNVVLHELRQSKPINVDEGVRDAFVCLELSYNYLRSSKAKLLFLVCALFPEDHEILIEDLFRYGVGLGLCEDADSFEIARSQVTTAINVLINSSLLLYSPNFKYKKCVMMHDLVRDVSLWIASKEHHTTMVNQVKEPNELFEDEAVKYCYAISSWNGNNKSHHFHSQWDAPELEILLLNLREPFDLSHESFQGVKGLKVVAMIGDERFHKQLMPQPIQLLSNLRTLRLQHWYLGDITFVVSLARLEILDLKGSQFKKLPNGVEKLKKLKLLDLTWCSAEECCCKVMGRCSQLEELDAPSNFMHLENKSCYECFMGIPALPKLRRWHILEMGQGNFSKAWKKGTRVLYLGSLDISISSAVIKGLAQRAIAIEFYKLQGGCNSFIPNMFQAVGGMNELTKLHLHSCSEIECLIDKMTPHEDAVVPRLVELDLEFMDNLGQLSRGPSLLRLFQNLERLTIWSCPQLRNLFSADCNLGNLKFLRISSCQMWTSLFPASVVCTLLSLEELRIHECHELKHVIEGEGGADAWEDMRFPKWEILSVGRCHQLESICPTFCVQGFVQLKHLYIEEASQLKFVFGEHDGEEPSIFDQNDTQIVLPLLEVLTLQFLPNLLQICSERHHPRWPSIKKIDWRYCPRFTCDSLTIGSELRQPHPNMELHALNGRQVRNEEAKPLATVSNIESIFLEECGVVSIFHYQTGDEEPKATISNGRNLNLQIPTFRHLESLYVNNCAKLKFLFSASIGQSLPELTSIAIFRCEELEDVFVENEQTQKNLSKAHSCLPKLRNLNISECRKLRVIFSAGISQSLQDLSFVSISCCEELEEIFVENEQTLKNQSIAQACLPKLGALWIKQCNKLKIIFSIRTSSVTTSLLPQLGTLRISEVSQLEEIFRCSTIEDHDIERAKEIILPNLKEIELEKLPRLVNVCQGFKLRIMKSCNVLIRECPKLVLIAGASAGWIIRDIDLERENGNSVDISDDDSGSDPEEYC